MPNKKSPLYNYKSPRDYPVFNMGNKASPPFKMKYKNSAFPFKESPLMQKYSVSGKGLNLVDTKKQSKVKPGTSKSAPDWKSGFGTGLQSLGDVIIDATRVK